MSGRDGHAPQAIDGIPFAASTPRSPSFREDGRDELEAAIAAALPKADAALEAGRLCQVFTSPAAALEARPEEVRACTELPSSLALILSLVPDLARRRLLERAMAAGPVCTAARAGAILRAVYLGEHYESCCLLALGEDGAFLRVDRIQSGTVNESPFYCRLAVEAALASGGAAFVFAHNHPGGTAFASGADLQVTRRLIGALRAVGLVLLDHLIIAGDGFVSLREEGLPSAAEWRKDAPLPPALRGWLDH